MTTLDRLARLVSLCLALTVCTPRPTPVPPPSPGGAGGLPATGGQSSSVGGWLPIGHGGAVVAGEAGMPAGGVAATGGASVAVVWPSCNEAIKAAPAVRPKLSGWHRDKQRQTRAKWRPRYNLVTATQSVFWQPLVEHALDQGALGSCTGNATAQTLSTRPFTARLAEVDAVRIYSRATEIDPFPGVYPPDDTGSAGVYAWQSAIDLGYTTVKTVAVSTLEQLQQALQSSGCILGTDWYSGFFTPTKCGELVQSGTIEGGHEIEIIGWNKEMTMVWIRNSWGDWGVSRGRETGFAYFSAGTLQKLLRSGAEIDCPVVP